MNLIVTRRSFISGAAALATMAGISPLLAGCSTSKEPIVGTWQNANSSSPSLEFYKDGNFSYTNSSYTQFGDLTGSWNAYSNNPVNVDGKRWYIYTTDSYMAGGTSNFTGTSSDIASGEYKEGRVDFCVNDDLMYAAVGWTLTSRDTWSEDEIVDYLSNLNSLTRAYLTYSRVNS